MSSWDLLSPQVQAAIVAAFCSVLVCIVAQLWSPITQRKLETMKAELRRELEIHLERTRDTIAAQKEGIAILTAAKERWEKSAESAPDNAVSIAIIGKKHGDASAVYKWLAVHRRNCEDIVSDIKPYLSHEIISSIKLESDKIYKALDSDDPLSNDKLLSPIYMFCKHVKEVIDSEIDRLVRSRLTNNPVQ